MKYLTNALKESLQSVLPIFAIVLVLSVTFAPMQSGVLVMFLFGTLLLILGMSFFTIGSGMSMQPLGEGIGAQLSRSKKMIVPILVSFVLGILITIAEPDLQVLAEQMPAVPNVVLVMSVALGVGLFLVISVIRTRKGIPLSRLLLIFYAVAMIFALFVSDRFVPTSFDSGGVTTGPITVPFIMALGAGIASMGKSKNAQENSFGLIALCSIGPILSVLILGLCFQPDAEASPEVITVAETTKEAFSAFLQGFPHYAAEVLMAFLPIVGVLIVFQVFFRRFSRHQFERICVGLLYTYVGLVLFLVGANVGFMPAGRLIGSVIAAGEMKYLLIPIGMLMGYFVVSAEPAVHSLKKQVEEITNGAITQKAIGLALSVGVALSVGIAMLRVLTGIPIYPFLLVGYAIALAITFFVPPLYTGIAFDSGGVASGPMTTTFMLPFAIGACEMMGGDVLTDAFGIVAMVAMAPLITIQVMGLYSRVEMNRKRKKIHSELIQIADDILYFEEV
ncbi:MAG: DUF1538 domain-containing protein [Clostridia bacterium]|nr:DUF1538 domain-containing protein [Clostridia bacterium]